MLIAPPPPPPPPPPPAAAPVIVKKIQSELDNGQLRTPTAIPKKIQMIKEDEPPPTTGPAGVVGGVPGWRSGRHHGWRSGQRDEQRTDCRAEGRDPAARSRVPRRFPGTADPQGARRSTRRWRGRPVFRVSVVLQALIGKDGTIQNLHVVSGHPMLTNAALEAVKEWQYKPYFLNGEPVEVETTINVNFTLSGE